MNFYELLPNSDGAVKLFSKSFLNLFVVACTFWQGSSEVSDSAPFPQTDVHYYP